MRRVECLVTFGNLTGARAPFKPRFPFFFFFSVSFEFDLNSWGVDSAKKPSRKCLGKPKKFLRDSGRNSNLFPVLFDRFVVFTSRLLHLEVSRQKRQNTNPHWPQWTGNSTRWDTWCNVLFTDSAAFSNYNKSFFHSLYCATFVRGKLAEARHNNLMEEKLFVCLDTLAILISIIACLLCGSCQKSLKVFVSE